VWNSPLEKLKKEKKNYLYDAFPSSIVFQVNVSGMAVLVVNNLF